MRWYRKALRRYADFGGRAGRLEFWTFQIAYTLVSVVLALVDDIARLHLGDTGFGTLGTVFALVVEVPALAVSARRLHDIDRSGWWLLLGLVPFAGTIVLLLWWVRDGQLGPHRVGPDPREAATRRLSTVHG